MYTHTVYTHTVTMYFACWAKIATLGKKKKKGKVRKHSVLWISPIMKYKPLPAQFLESGPQVIYLRSVLYSSVLTDQALTFLKCFLPFFL